LANRRKKYIGEGSGGRLRPPADPGESRGRGSRGGKASGRKRDLAFWGNFSWPLRLSILLPRNALIAYLMNHILTEILKVKTYTLHTFSFKHIFVG